MWINRAAQCDVWMDLFAVVCHACCCFGSSVRVTARFLQPSADLDRGKLTGLFFSFLLPPGERSCYLRRFFHSRRSRCRIQTFVFFYSSGGYSVTFVQLILILFPFILALVLCFYFLVILFHGLDVATLVVRLRFSWRTFLFVASLLIQICLSLFFKDVPSLFLFHFSFCHLLR